eukprot:1928166-Rhodomonas_salina.1
MRFPANLAFVPRQAVDLGYDARHALWTAVRACRSQDLCPMHFPANLAFVPRQAADLGYDARHALWKAVRA